MDKLKMMSMDMVQGNIEKIKALFPNAVTEVLRDGEPTLAVDFDVLKQELSAVLVDDKEERYQFTWPDKKKSILLANTPISATLRPCKEESVDFDNTQNLYIEGDNLDVLKLLQETYLGKIKMIYIDPPYNTGNDFVYNDDFSESAEEYAANSGQYDDQGNRLVQNTESNGRFHTDWLNMIYPRLKVAKDLLSDDGVIFISIDDNEVENLKKICNEIFGAENSVGNFVWVKKKKGSHLSKTIRSMTEFILCFTKNISLIELFGEEAYSDKLQPLAKRTNSVKELVFPSNCIKTTLRDGLYKSGIYGEGSSALSFKNDFNIKNSLVTTELVVGGPFVWTQEKLNIELKNGTTVHLSSKYGFNVLRSDQSEKIKRPSTLIDSKIGVGTNEDAYEESISIFGTEGILSYPKPTSLMRYLINSVTYYDQNAIILDFFSGSSTTAHAIMQLNAKDGGARKFIMVQLPEKCDESSEAYKAGYKNICEIGKERIRRAGSKIAEELYDEKWAVKIDGIKVGSIAQATELLESKEKQINAIKEDIKTLDIGFRVLKLDSSNMKDVYYKSNEYSQDLLSSLENNIKEDRTPLDLLFQVMLELGKPLSAKIEETEIAGKHVFAVDGNDLIACFDTNITEEVVKEIALKKPLYAVFRDSSLENDSANANLDQIFATYSPNTTRKVL